ncbi:MAG: 4Fe-4S binding protein [Euryarchaeota archaeon]
MIKVNIDKCGHCGACVSVCPTNSITLIESCLEIADTCTACETCVTICPVGALAIC